MNDIVAKSDEVDGRLDDGEIVRSLVHGLRRQGLFARWLLVSILLDVLLTFAIVFFITRGNEQRAAIQKNTANQFTGCLIGNEFRRNERQLWNHVLGLPPPPGQTPEQIRARTIRNGNITAYLDKTFKPRVCARSQPLP